MRHLVMSTVFIFSSFIAPVEARVATTPHRQVDRFADFETRQFTLSYRGRFFDQFNDRPITLLQDLVQSGQVGPRERDLFQRGEVELVQMQVFAKSRFGQAQMALRVGNQTSFWQTVSGNQWEFDRDEWFTFFEIPFTNPNRFNASPAPWQLLMRGPQGRYNIRIDRVVFTVRLPRQSHRPTPPHRPVPPPNRPVPPVNPVQFITCQSMQNNSLRTLCHVDGRIERASISREFSHQRCERNGLRNWGIAEGGRAIWVQQGCRADFRVEVSRW